LKFNEKWKQVEKTSLQEKIKDKVSPKAPLKGRLDQATKRMQIQIQKLDKAERVFSNRDKSLFAKTVKAYSKHDMMRANVYANELVELRKTKKQISTTKLALEQISLRLGTVSEFGDVVNLLSPTADVLQNIGKGISTALPEAGKELGSIGNLLSDIMSETHQSGGIDLDFDAPNDAAQSILNEAAQVAEETVAQKLPEIPTDIPAAVNNEKVLANT
jgi:division protein CdvB (Snf7/Vps24/ESCRT-III family)